MKGNLLRTSHIDKQLPTAALVRRTTNFRCLWFLLVLVAELSFW
jgi:hypothetical protein